MAEAMSSMSLRPASSTGWWRFTITLVTRSVTVPDATRHRDGVDGSPGGSAIYRAVGAVGGDSLGAQGGAERLGFCPAEFPGCRTGRSRSSGTGRRSGGPAQGAYSRYLRQLAVEVGGVGGPAPDLIVEAVELC